MQQYLNFNQLCYYKHFEWPSFSQVLCCSSTRTFWLARVQHCQPLSQSKFIPSEYCIGIMRESNHACGLKTSISRIKYNLL